MEVSYSVEEECVDDSRNILSEIRELNVVKGTVSGNLRD